MKLIVNNVPQVKIDDKIKFRNGLEELVETITMKLFTECYVHKLISEDK
jgi:hypothetical protein